VVATQSRSVLLLDLLGGHRVPLMERGQVRIAQPVNYGDNLLNILYFVPSD